jgi:hypothetical protein|tara:strand:+ start:4093 stop:4284 length:192 start_codon:yes stop_codon:yes gene_type:complete
VQRYALAQREYPHGIGIKMTLELKEEIVGRRPLHEIRLDEFEMLMSKLEKEYVIMKNKKGNKQ